MAALMMLGLAGPAEAAGGYPQSVTDTAGLLGYWRLGERSGTTAADVTGRAPGSLLGGVSLGAHGGLSLDADTAARFDGVDDELQTGDSSLALADAGSLESWFFWESGVALMRDNTTGSGWILAYDSGRQVAYRVRGSSFTTGLAVSQLRDGWHHVALTVQGQATAFYVDGEPVHAGTTSGSAPVALPWHVMRNGAVTGQFTRGRADEIAVYDRALNAETVRAHFLAGRDVADVTPPAVPSGVTATARFGSVEVDWSGNGESDLDGYDVFRGTSPTGPFARVNASRLEASTYTDTSVAAGTTYIYVVTASDVANNRSANSATVTATPPSTTDLLRQYAPELRYETQESYFADSAAEMTDNYVSGSQTNYLVDGSGTRIAAANPANALADLSLGFLGNPLYADGRAATDSDYLDAANTTYQQDAQRMRAAGYGDRIYGRVVSSAGRTWLQYWIFYYYNPQNVIGFGVHEGDWEFAQVALDSDGAPTVATYAQHDSSERCVWSQVRRTSAGAPVVYVALASHASYFAPGVASRGWLPDDYHRGDGYRVRPQLEVITPSTPFMAWRGRWGASSSSPIAPRRQGKWGDPAGFESNAAACTAPSSAATATRRRPRSSVPAPQIRVRRLGGEVVVDYRFPATRRRPVTLLVSVAPAGAPDVATARRTTIRSRTGTVRLAVASGADGPVVVQASAFSQRGTRSAVKRVPVS
ncbi:hypothetical protein OM076_10215 [Solirubrobacter ginsenosidimutans]|uniref:Fibronectin type-III domain-containing protein n=1 Tax=Solirubrobacter ginsenosidimutans TaxID=490573 RepID=A0A9X3MQ47_9ACTN|nr:hypothetical protein [Solirubrobacter ginsenosidimutans]